MRTVTREDAEKVLGVLQRRDAMLDQARIALDQGVRLMVAAAEELGDEHLLVDQLNLALLSHGQIVQFHRPGGRADG